MYGSVLSVANLHFNILESFAYYKSYLHIAVFPSVYPSTRLLAEGNWFIGFIYIDRRVYFIGASRFLCEWLGCWDIIWSIWNHIAASGLWIVWKEGREHTCSPSTTTYEMLTVHACHGCSDTWEQLTALLSPLRTLRKYTIWVSQHYTIKAIFFGEE